LGYVNFSAGRPDPRVEAQFFALWPAPAERPWEALHQQLAAALDELHRAGNAAFRDIAQAGAVLDLALVQLPPAYRRHHADLLFHLSEPELFQAGLLVRMLEAVLAQEGPWDERDRILAGALKRLNDYVGYRPVAVLEGKHRGELYPHERLRPVPLFLRGAGVAPGRFAPIVERALKFLQATPAALCTEAYFDLGRMDELAFDPRAYDHYHPADKRPNYRFGEWDPHHIDNHGFYRRMVVRQLLLDGLMERVDTTADLPRDELLEEAGALLATTVLMASGLSGAGPDTHDSSVHLGNLLPLIARYRDASYTRLLAGFPADHAARLKAEAEQTRQPFGGVRQHLNHYFARQRAAQMQQRHLALVLAGLGYPEAARRYGDKVPAASLRLLTEIHLSLGNAQTLGEAGKLAEAAEELAGAEAVLRRAIACGAMVDPWNVLGFQGLFPLFTAAEDSVPDHRVGDLVQVVDRCLTQYVHLRSEAAAAGQGALNQQLAERAQHLAGWWDQFATTTVNNIPHVRGSDAAASAEHVAEALGRWRERGEATADLAFWRQHLDRFQTAKAFAVVVDALLRKNDFRAAMALLMNWLAQAAQVPLEEGDHSFHFLAMRWMLGLRKQIADGTDVAAARELVAKFLDYLESNAEELWEVPRLAGQEVEVLPMPRVDDGDEGLFGAAYEGVTYQDSTDDGNEGELLGFEPKQDFELEAEADQLAPRLRFLSSVARLMHLGGRCLIVEAPGPRETEVLTGWLARARQNSQELLALLDAVHERPVPAPSGSYNSVIEFDRRNSIKQRLVGGVLGTCLETTLAVGSLVGMLSRTEEAPAAGGKRPGWEPALLQLEKALWAGDTEAARTVLPRFLESFQHEPLMFLPLEHGGHPRQILRASIAQTLLRALAVNLPRLGLLRETYGLLRVAQTMERGQRLDGPPVTEFHRLFHVAWQASVEAVVAAVLPPADDAGLLEGVKLLGRLIRPYHDLWTEHNRTLRLSILETVGTEEAWGELREFVKKYGGGLFHARFMTANNLQGILHRGVAGYLKYLEDNPDPQQPVSLVDDLDAAIPREQAERHLAVVLQAVLENYEEYKDYNTTTIQSDYGENLHVLLDFLRLKAAYDRQAWQLRPLLLAHDVLCRHNPAAAALWQREVERLTSSPAEQFLARLAELEKEHGIRLRTVGDRVRERFVQALALDRVCALVEPAYEQARAAGPQDALPRLEAALQPYLEAPTGSGLDVPAWLRRLEAEVQRVQLRHTAVTDLAEQLLQVPRVVLTPKGLRGQLEDWPRP
jgi:hypothetical protein